MEWKLFGEMPCLYPVGNKPRNPKYPINTLMRDSHVICLLISLTDFLNSTQALGHSAKPEACWRGRSLVRDLDLNQGSYGCKPSASTTELFHYPTIPQSQNNSLWVGPGVLSYFLAP